MKLIKTKMIEPLTGLLKQGITPDALAWSLTAGAVLAVFPVFGITTALCVLFAMAFRLNQVAIQVANYCAYPLQFLLFIPFLRMGESLFGRGRLSTSPADIFALARSDFTEFVDLYGMALLSACTAWALTAIPASLVLWKGLSLITHRLSVSES